MSAPAVSAKVRVFPPAWERFNLAFGLAGIAIVVADLLLRPSFDTTEWAVIRLFSQIVFLNSLHTTLTFLMVWKVPEVRGLLRESWGSGAKWPALAFLAMPPLFLWQYSLTSQHPIMTAEAALWTMFLVRGVAGFHHIAQIRGISLLYNRVAEKESAGFQSGFGILERQERNLFRALAAAIFLSLPLIHYQRLLPPQLQILKVLLPLTIGSLLAAILAVSWRYPRELVGKKLFLARIFCIGAIPFSPLASFVSKACHGTEYLLVTHKIFSGSRLNPNARLDLSLIAFVLLPMALVYFLHNVPELLPNAVFDSLSARYRGILVASLAGISFACECVHYYLDGMLFRMRDPIARASLGPLIVA